MVPNYGPVISRTETIVTPNSAGYTHVTTGAVTSVTFSDLAKYNANYWRLDFQVEMASAAAILRLHLRPNAAATNCTSVALMGVSTTSAATADPIAELQLAVEGDGDRIAYYGQTYLEADTGQRRRFNVASAVYRGGAGPRTERAFHGEGFYNDTSTVISSLQVLADAASSIAIGSRFRLFAGYVR